MSKDNLGNRMKQYEKVQTETKLIPRLPVYARLDGRSFSRFTKDMKKPFDIDFENTMRATTIALIREFNATIGYVQSDEISLIWIPNEEKENTEFMFSGKLHKLNSILSGKCSSFFYSAASKKWPDLCIAECPCFDCRVFNLPTLVECSNILLWRELDATKNSINSACRSIKSHKELQNKNCKEMQEILFQNGINWNDYRPHSKKGTYYTWIGREESRELMELTIPPLIRIMNKVGVLFSHEISLFNIPVLERS